MADLEFPVAMSLATSLTTIGHPPHSEAIRFTAMDLIKECRGGFFDGRPWSPEQQAEEIVEEIRTTWTKWPEGGTGQLLNLIRTRFPKPAPPKAIATPSGIDPETRSLLERGHLKPPCKHCAPGEPFCPYNGEKQHARQLDSDDLIRAQQATRLEKYRDQLRARRPISKLEPMPSVSMEELRRQLDELAADARARKEKHFPEQGA